ncbi:arsenite methyltransferase [candidate division KSB3 bacterium]|uniref:Arsenite methyltransferase n=1 Tax=candidate division KSB3 bacterium TaxID=2044937 RepID=A0A9D5JYX0_9BACT|nr:arsenite methyltransferase [candidate division KSB3 bacterium]MBD3326768.1 arsenite methyltransferase [candidate division KSB3 bacterium]
MQTAESLKNLVKEKYAQLVQRSSQCCCSSSCCSDEYTDDTLSEGYSQLEGYYAEADLHLGCGIPTHYAQIRAGDVVLDLGSGAGNDVFVARSLVGDQGKVIGVDMTEEMIVKARQNQRKLGYHNVEFRLGEIEALPLEENEVDVVISNCVLNLVPDKSKAFEELFRVLKPGGHFCISDIVLHGDLPEKLKTPVEMYAGCVAGAILQEEYLYVIRQAGFVEVEVKQEKQVTLPDALLQKYLSADELKAYRSSGSAVVSLMVFGQKPATGRS